MRREEEQQGKKKAKSHGKKERQTEVACVLAERFGGIEVIVNEGEFL